MIVPILLDHDHTKPIGSVELVDGELHVRFTADMKITKDMAFQIFGDTGLMILDHVEEDGVMLIRGGRIVEWSLLPNWQENLNDELTGPNGPQEKQQ